MQDGFVFFSQKTTRVSFDQRFLSFLMGFAGQRYDFNRTANRAAEQALINVRRAYEMGTGAGRAASETFCCRGWALYCTIQAEILGNEGFPHGI